MIEIKKYSHQSGHPEPRRVIKYTLFWCCNGNAEVLIDENMFVLNTNQVITITSGQFHQLMHVEGELSVLEFFIAIFMQCE